METQFRKLNGEWSILASVVEKSHMPVMDRTVLFRVVGGRGTLEAMSHDFRVRVALNLGEIDGPDVAGVLPIKALKALTDAPWSAHSDAPKIVISSEGTEASLHAIPADDYPAPIAFEHADGAQYDAAQLLETLTWVRLAASADKGQPHLNGVRLRPGELAGTDGHRLHLARGEWIVGPEGEKQPGRDPNGTVLPLRFCDAVIKALKATARASGAHLSWSDGGQIVCFEAGPWTITCRANDGQFPPIHKVIPDGITQRSRIVRVESSTITKALAKLAKLSSEAPITITSPGEKLTLTRTDPGGGTEVSLSVPCEIIRGDFADFRMGIYHSYLADAIADLDGIVELSFSHSSVDAVCIYPASEGPAEHLAIVMPRRL